MLEFSCVWVHWGSEQQEEQRCPPQIPSYSGRRLSCTPGIEHVVDQTMCVTSPFHSEHFYICRLRHAHVRLCTSPSHFSLPHPSDKRLGRGLRTRFHDCQVEQCTSYIPLTYCMHTHAFFIYLLAIVYTCMFPCTGLFCASACKLRPCS